MVPFHAAFTAAVRGVGRVHRHAAHRGTLALPGRASGFALGDVSLVASAELADRGHALDAELADLARRQLYESDVAFLAEQLRRTAGRANHLPALAGKQLEVVHHRAGRDVADLQRVAGKDVRAFAV